MYKTDWTQNDYINFEDFIRQNINENAVSALLWRFFRKNVTITENMLIDTTALPTYPMINAREKNVFDLAQAYDPSLYPVLVYYSDFNIGGTVRPSAPSCEDWNRWEQIPQIIADRIAIFAVYLPHCGVGACGQGHMRQNYFRRYF